ncbi:hypothetical protein CLG96_17485 [Sphingomonas oleivorans]|uniref:Uncharacterized protein n=1 Tax=Sphingomonas oleivorans TaxID=1735121 RepID=A0A2T5FTF4_9SPHN|nr:hypothetical protein [Sphingomonas oleivorans]PTQ07346.1 hypothetical protein CLG96_17485 [Sphingomonas oleivorans]
MAFRSHRLLGLIALAGVATAGFAEQASAYLFWSRPNFAGAPVRGDEPGIALPMPGATPKEVQAGLLWNLRAGLNVAALQCQFAPALMTVRNYNNLLSQHARELNDAYGAITGYFKRTTPKGWQVALDQYTTKTYNSFSTLHAQRGFCEVAGELGRDGLSRPKGKFHETAITRMREFRNSLVPRRDLFFVDRELAARTNLLPLDPTCWDKKNRLVKRCRPAA